MKPIDLAHRQFGYLTVITRADNNRHGKAQWLCQCSCGNRKEILAAKLLNGETKSCGCYKIVSAKKNFTKHGLAGTRVYSIWSNMLNRCTDQKNKSFYRYGGAGITLCERWRKFENFYADMGEPPSAMHSIDRIDNTLGYAPDNCRWATYKEQSMNSRIPILLTLNGTTKNKSEWASHLGINISTLIERLQKWSLEDALTTPKTHKTRRHN